MSKIILKIEDLAKKLGKSITDIAQETGLNRNTVTALYHGKVEGIRFDTITRLCEEYDIGIADLIELDLNKKPAIKSNEFYKQEGELIPFTSWPFGLEAVTPNRAYFTKGYGSLHAYFKGNYAEAFFPIDNINAIASDVFERYKEADAIDKLFSAYKTSAKSLEEYFFIHNDSDFLALPKQQFMSTVQRISDAYSQFWGMSLFIDAFDAGYDHQKITEISARYGFNLEEIGQLTTPTEMTFNNERLLELFELVRKFKKQKEYPTVLEFATNDHESAEYRKKFDYYKSNYCYIKHISADNQAEEMSYWLNNESEFKSQHADLKKYAIARKRSIGQVLKKYKIDSNPLYFFQVLTYWREHRKKVNLMGIHLLFSVLDYLEKHTGIKQEYLKFINPDEVSAVLNGSITQEILMSRYNGGMFASFDGQGYKITLGKEAESLRNQYSGNMEEFSDKILNGQVASQGYAKGLARVVLSQADFAKFQEGEILVTSMTRPEYLPIMKLAAAIVTNEGGVTCHAAIVARELGKPCIIGTKSATQVIKDGDLVEVRANHGTVRILS